MTKREGTAIKRYWAGSYYRVSIKAGDEVWAQARRGGAWGLLYTWRQAHSHLVAVGLRTDVEGSK